MQISNLDFSPILNRFPTNPTDSLMCLFMFLFLSASAGIVPCLQNFQVGLFWFFLFVMAQFENPQFEHCLQYHFVLLSLPAAPSAL